MLSVGSSLWLEEQPPRQLLIHLRATPDRWPCYLLPLYSDLAGHGPGLRAPTLQVGETEALAKNRKQSKSKFEFNIIALRENGYLECPISPSSNPCSVPPLKPDQNFLLQETVPGESYPAITTHASIHASIHPLIQSVSGTSMSSQPLSSLHFHEH